MLRTFILSAFTLLTSVLPLSAQPRLINKGKAVHLEVKGKCMLIIGGELGNSSATTLADCQRIFPKLNAMGLNTVLAPVYWHLIEPEEGQFDFCTVKNVIDEARNNNLKVVFLWFGAWKNSMSCYAPEWFKRDTKRFPRAHAQNGRPVEEASSLSANVLAADKKAFCRLMEFIRNYDSSEQTVIMMQVENEIGMIDVPRDYSDDATKLYNSNVPDALRKYLKANKKHLHPHIKKKLRTTESVRWHEMFGDDIYTEEIFQAWTYAVYAEQIAAAGRYIYNLPMFVNVALNSRNRKPGEYPSGGPLAHLVDIWKCGAPSIDIMALDLYDKGFRDWTARYHMPNAEVLKTKNPLFIPEIRLEDQDGVRALYAFGEHDAIGFCPFSIEDYTLTKKNEPSVTPLSREDLTKDDQLNLFSQKTEATPPLVASYRLLQQAEHIILEHQGTENIYGVLLDNDMRKTSLLTADGIRLTVKHSYSLGWEPRAKDDTWPEVGCIVIRQGKEDYIVIGSGIVITYEKDKIKGSTPQDGERIGLATCEIVEYKDGRQNIVRHLSGDQTHQGRHVRIPVGQWQIQHFKLYPY